LNLALSAILIIYVAIQTFDWWLEYINLRHEKSNSAADQPEFKGIFDEDTVAKMRLYLGEKTQFSLFTSGISSIALLVFLLAGLLDHYNNWIASLGWSSIISGWLFFVILFVAVQFLSIPFSLHFTFNIENKYGFNNMSYHLWALDFLKSLVLSVVLLSVVILAGFWFIIHNPNLWWLYFWAFSLAFTLFVTYLSPYVIEPLFNKFTPIDDALLTDRIVDLAAKSNINVAKVLKVDESKRSTHTNAYFTGIGRTKRIILFDTLLQTMNSNEILSILAHEMGHWKKRHLLKTLVISQAFSLVIIFISSRLMEGTLLTNLFGIDTDTLYVKVLIVAFLISMVTFFLKPLINVLSRSFERQADRYACDLSATAQPMISALIKLSKDNLSNLYPHPLYALVNYSHPPVIERLRYLKEYGEKLHH
jgi:STE24 endopeptidase